MLSQADALEIFHHLVAIQTVNGNEAQATKYVASLFQPYLVVMISNYKRSITVPAVTT